jgi:predicted thioesterase
MNKPYKTVASSNITISELMLPSHTILAGKYMVAIYFPYSIKHLPLHLSFWELLCHSSVDTVDFLNPIEVGELVTMKASVNYVGNSSMIIGIRVESENIQTGAIKHCNSSYFTMVSKTKMVRTKSPRPSSSLEEVRRFINCLKQISLKKEKTVTKKF